MDILAGITIKEKSSTEKTTNDDTKAVSPEIAMAKKNVEAITEDEAAEIMLAIVNEKKIPLRLQAKMKLRNLTLEDIIAEKR